MTTDKKLPNPSLEEMKRLRSLLDIAREINKETDLHALMLKLARKTSEAMEAERSTVFLYDRNSNELWSIVAEGEHREIKFGADSGIAGHVFINRQPLIINDAYRDPRFNRDIDRITGFKTRNCISLPIINAREEALGVLQVLNRISGDFYQEDTEFLEAIANQAAITIENVQLFEERKRMFYSLIDALAESIESRDPYTAGHSRNVMHISMKIAEYMGLPSGEIQTIRYAALLHDYGKIGVPESILWKPGDLTEDEYEKVKTHVIHTKHILSKIDFEKSLDKVPLYASQHHERISGNGYPDGLTGEKISIGGKIIAVADVFESLTSKRHYRDPLSAQEAFIRILEETGKEFAEEPVSALKEFLIDEGNIIEDSTDTS